MTRRTLPPAPTSTRSTRPTLLRARAMWAHGTRWIDGGALLVRVGRIERVLATRAEIERCDATRIDLGEAVLVPGFVDAHAHLELSGLAGTLPRGGDFVAWIGALLRARAARTPDLLAQDWSHGARALLASGTTAVGDIDSSGAVLRADALGALRVRRFHELLDACDPTRTPAQLSLLRKRAPRRRRLYAGFAPHAPYTVGAELAARIAVVARTRRLPLSIHWAETSAEEEWLAEGRGPFAAILPPGFHARGLERIQAAGLLGPRTVLVHANVATQDERSRVASAGACVVHCPGAHAFFERERFDAAAWLARGVRLALGTDSAAGNDALDMRREMALLRASNPQLAPHLVLDLATRHAAHALGFEGRAGELSPGAWADFALHELENRSLPALTEELTHGRGIVRATWVGGAPVAGERAAS